MLPRLSDLAATSTAGMANPYTHINCVANAAGFFNNIRTPATLLVIPALNSLWLDLSSTTRRTKHPVAQTLYTVSVMLTVLFELVCVFVATVTGTKLLAGGFDPMGPDAVTLLVREFELPYIATHLTFVSGLVTFLSSIGLRAWIQFGDIHPRTGRALTLLTLTCVINMVTYFHQSINTFHLGLPGLLVRFFVLYLVNFGLMGVISLASIGVSIYWLSVAIRDQLVQHGAPTGQLSMHQLPREPSNSEDDFKEAIRSWKPVRQRRRAEPPATRLGSAP
mmetsp:Transcript_6253/g.13632  ORF Transcript_6253/g.13632 Transcript_6253/m.13632 type:complete len:278 (-) Transcript_6253:214-1047(-)|eukprot:CAMPEP_0183335188 /NCGR_PEP_ID=MMETSP0164_2-20130417/3568_1 /TAXON_ID=221442 /ORGANISM="Coccolithus pelagicus ssp braarudi, Strain PLY182g" /LENGTH=277 /DNA_ID=CAMNT_0025504495 /DNA_START=16 /DNA_END=849 /DNA_ORIENTATION=+